MNVLGDYEAASGQKTIKEKSYFYMHEKAPADEVNTVHLITEFQWQSFPFTYLGCPIFYSIRRKDFCKSIFSKFKRGYHHGRNGAWNEGLLRELLPDELADHILDSITPPSDYSMKDKPWWKLETKGQFTVKSAWKYIRKRRDASKLYRNPKEETLPHVFLTSPAARFVWNYFGAPISTSIQMFLNMRRPGFKEVTTNWSDLHEKLLNHIPRLRFTKVLWQLPPDRWIKCNTDGAFRGEFGGASYGFCIRDSIGDLMYAQADVVEEATNNIAEAQAILEAAMYIIQMQFPPCIIEIDSLLMNKVLEDVWEPPWSISNQVDEIKSLLSKGMFQVIHVLREGNKLADHLANLTLDQQHMMQAHSFWELESEGRKILNNDKLQIPYLRVRTAKTSDN
nr:uncharacterized protein LOC117276617 [Nicotiana tomentosiformis]